KDFFGGVNPDDADGRSTLVLTTVVHADVAARRGPRALAVPYWLSPKHDTLIFWGEPDYQSHDARGRCYNLFPRSAPGEAISCVNEGKSIPAAAQEADAVEVGTRTLTPEEGRAYNPVECIDAGCLSKGARAGGYWFYEKSVTFTSDFVGPAKLN